MKCNQQVLLWLILVISKRKPKQYLGFGLRYLSLPAQNRWQSVRFWCVTRRITYCRRCTANYIDTLYVQNNISLVTVNNPNANKKHFLNKNHTFCGEFFFSFNFFVNFIYLNLSTLFL